MKKRIISIIMITVLLMSCSVTGFAASKTLVIDSSYDADTNTVLVSLSVQSPGALQAADFCLAYDPAVYEYVDFDTSASSSNAMIAAGLSTLDTGLTTCSIIFTNACTDDDLDENDCLQLVTFSFRPLTDSYNIDDFCLWATSYTVKNRDIVKKIDPVGETSLKEGHTVVVTVNPTTASSSLFGLNSKTLVYLIAGLLAVAAIAGIAVIAIKNNQEEEEAQKAQEEDSADAPSDETDEKPE